MSEVITIDCDDVLSETIDAILAYTDNIVHGKIIHRKDVSSHDLNLIKKYHITFQERFNLENRLFHDPDALNLIEPVKGAKEEVLALKEAGIKMYVITGRHSGLVDHTYQWIEKYFDGIFEDILFSNFDIPDKYIPKSELCARVGSKLQIDDDIRFSRDIADSGVPVILMDKPWNQEYDIEKDKNIIKVNEWKDISVEYIEETIKKLKNCELKDGGM